MSVTIERRRELAAKVRDVMGELATIELDGIPLADLIEPTECDACSTPNRFEELTAEIHEAYENLADALDRRLMPEGMEWPRFEDGEPVHIEDEVVDEAEGLMFHDCERCTQLDTACAISKDRDLVRRCRALAERGE